ncbi:signal peptidase II [Nocardioides sp. C4-1]|uniref:signal peptidase II n=1 Tax=Nocardioides sp. C4-1 TaxID=3151851 RepID=UPI003263D86D
MQAARGTPVGSITPRLRWIFITIAGLAYAVDQVSKYLAEQHLEGRPDVQVIGEILQLHLTYNPGAAFSTGTGFTPVITIVAIIATAVVLWYSRRIGSTAWAVALGLLLAGITGNLTDRLLRDPGPMRGHVVDMLMLPNWPVFNVADVCINVAAGLIIIQALRGVRLDGTREGEAVETADETADKTAEERAE